MSKSEDISRFFTAWIGSRVNFDNIWKLIRVHLLRQADTTRYSLICIHLDFVPK